MKAVAVEALPEYRIKLAFDDETTGIVDLTELVQKGIFKTLADINLFNKVYISGSAIAWSDELEIDAFALYAEIKKQNPENLLQTIHDYATD